MQPTGPRPVTELLLRWKAGDRQGLDQAVPLVDHELRRIAHRAMRSERPGHTLQTTALVNEAYLRLVDQSRVNWQNRAHFLGVAAGLMRQILVDHARRVCRAKRGGGVQHLPLDEGLVYSPAMSESLLVVDEALSRLAEFDARKARVVELRSGGAKLTPSFRPRPRAEARRPLISTGSLGGLCQVGQGVQPTRKLAPDAPEVPRRQRRQNACWSQGQRCNVSGAIEAGIDETCSKCYCDVSHRRIRSYTAG